MTGLPYRKLQYMRAFAAAWDGHIMVLIDKLDGASSREWYAAAVSGGAGALHHTAPGSVSFLLSLRKEIYSGAVSLFFPAPPAGAQCAR